MNVDKLLEEHQNSVPEESPDNAVVLCNVVVEKTEEMERFCLEPITELFTIANDAVLPICPRHMELFEQGHALVVREIAGDRVFYVQKDPNAKEVENG